MNIQKSLILSGCVAFVAVGSYYLFFQSSDTGENIVSPRPTADLVPLKSSSVASSAEAHVEAQIPLPTDSVAQAHPAGCAHCSQSQLGASGKIQTVASEAARPAPIAFTKEVREKLLNHNKGQNIQFTLPGGGIASGVVDGTTDKNGRRLSIEGTLRMPRVGRFLFTEQTLPGGAGDMFGAVYFEEGDVAYGVEPGADGTPVLKEKHVDQVICQGYAIPEAILQTEVWEVEEIPADHPDVTNIPAYQNGVIPLSSLPNSLAVVYLDFDGELAPHSGWNNVDAESYNLSNSQIKDLWARTAEEFAPFNINVTTDLQVYLDAPENSRQRCIITPTTAVYSGSAGGVAYVNGFNSSGDTPCWCFYTGNAGALVIAHEVGHTLGLSHDGNASSGYDGGHSTTPGHWGPIMGAPYGSAITHWSKGEYADANQTQDDLVIIDQKNNVSLRSDDHGATLATASIMEVLADDSVENGGIIETDADFDSFKFTVTASSGVSLTVSGSSPGQNLDILAEIVDSTGFVVASDNAAASLDATVAATLAAGEYFLRVTGEGFGDPAGAGFSSYGSLGFYTVSGTVPSAIQPDRFSVAENSVNTTSVGSVTPRNTHENSVDYSFASGNSSGAFAIDSATGALTVADSALFDYETLSAYYEDPVTFELFVDITNATIPALNETVRVVVTVTDVNEAPTITVPSGSPYLLKPTNNGYSLFTVSGSDPDDQLSTYTITAGNSGGEFAIDANSGEVTVANSAAINASSQSSYNLTIQISDGQSPPLTDSSGVTIPVFSAPAGYTPGTLTQKYYENITGSLLSDFTSDPDFPANPDSITSLTSFSVGAHGDNYGSTISGVIFVPVTGSYTFWLASDDQGELLLSTDHSAANASKIASVTEWTNSHEWDKYPGAQESTPVTLQAGQAYYIEARYKEGGGGDHCAVAWSGPGIPQQVIGSQFIALVLGNPPVAGDTSATLSENDVVGTTVATVNVTDSDAGDTHNYSITAGDTASAFSIDSSGNITTATALNHEETSSYNLTVTVIDSTGRSDTATVTVTITDVDESAFTGLVAWEDAIYNDATPVEQRTQTLAGNASASVDLSAVSGDSSFEFIVEAEDFGQGAVELLKDSSWGLNLEAWNDTNVLGMVRFGVADYSAAAETGQSVSSPYGNQVHIVYAVDTVAGFTRIYVNGVFVGSVNQLPVIDSATATLGSSSNVRNDTDPGIHAFAAYNSVLSAQDIITRYRAWFGASSPVDADGDALDDAWELTHYGVLGTIDETDDSDGDGYTAFEEMVFGMNPTVNDSGSAPIQGSIVDDGGTDKLQVKFSRPQNWATLNVTYQLQTGSDLVELNWADDATTPTITTDGTNEWVTYLLPLPSGDETRTFYRCKVSLNP